MEFRKIVRFGKGSYIVSLPKDWVVKNDLKKGSILSIDQHAQTLILSAKLSEEEQTKKQITIQADDKSIEEIKTEIVTAYITNYDLIELTSKKLDAKGEEIKRIILNLAGLEILEQTSTKIIAKYLLDIKEISLESLIRRMDNINRSLMADVISCIGGPCNYESIRARDQDVNRLHFLIVRTARADICSPRDLLGKSEWELHTVIDIAERLEKIADRQKRIARSLAQLKLSSGFSRELLSVFEALKTSVVDVMKAYYENDKSLARKLELSSRKRNILCDRLLSRDLKNDYQLLLHRQKQLLPYIHEHMFVTDLVFNLKAVSRSVKMIARSVLDRDQ